MPEGVLPTVRLLFVCERAVRDLQERKWVLHRPLSTVRLPTGANFPFRADEVWVYAQFTGGLGATEVLVEMFHLLDDLLREQARETRESEKHV